MSVDSTIANGAVFDTEGTLEEYMDTYYHGVFNTDYVANTATYTSPEMNRDVSSELQVCIVIRALFLIKQSA